MIGRLSGEIVSKKPPQILIDVNGVGYEVEAPMTTFYVLPDAGQSVVLLTHLVVREDAHLLFGFATEEERSMFRHLIRINGVGAKLALTILSGISTDDLIRCVQKENVTALVKLPGIGKKTAERLIIELKDRLKDLPVLGKAVTNVMQSSQDSAASAIIDDAISALMALGYKTQEAKHMVSTVEETVNSSEELIRLALQSVVVA